MLLINFNCMKQQIYTWVDKEENISKKCVICNADIDEILHRFSSRNTADRVGFLTCSNFCNKQFQKNRKNSKNKIRLDNL